MRKQVRWLLAWGVMLASFLVLAHSDPFAPRASLSCYAATPLLYLLPTRFDRYVRDDP